MVGTDGISGWNTSGKTVLLKRITFLKNQPVSIATLAIPTQDAQNIADRLIRCGIRAIWNFAHVDLVVPEHVFVENMNLIESLMQLSYRLNKDNR